MSTPVTDLGHLLASMDPELQPGTDVFCALIDEEPPPGSAVRLMFRQLEGTTVVVPIEAARSGGLEGHAPSEWIVLRVESDLGAVGFLAVTEPLVAFGMSTNVVSAIHRTTPSCRRARAAERSRCSAGCSTSRGATPRPERLDRPCGPLEAPSRAQYRGYGQVFRHPTAPLA